MATTAELCHIANLRQLSASGKSARLSNWEATQLTDAQKVYAATDAVTCIHLYNELKALRESNGYVLLRDEQPIAQ